MSKSHRMIKVAMVKAQFEWGDRAGNLRLLEELAGPLAKSKIDVLITPECFLDGYMIRDRSRCTRRKLLARSVTGPKDPMVRQIGRLAKRLKCYLVFGASEKDKNGTIRNAAFLLDRQGRHVGTYYKTHPCECYAPGDALPVFGTDFGTVGIVICADRRWPENIRCLRLKGAQIILNPTWGWWGEGNTVIMRTRAYENGIPVCFTHPQESLICLADGTVGAVLQSNQPAVLVHQIDLSRNENVKRTADKADSHPVQNRRPELYGPIVATR